MIIKSHIRGGYRAAADYMKDIGKNETTRVVEMSDPSAKDLDDAFQNMWAIACKTQCKKPLHHISINPMKDERLTDEQVRIIADRCEEAYGYKMFHHQRVIIEHVRDGRQHFHVIWNRVSLMTGAPVWPGLHWKKSKEVAREMEDRFGLKKPSQKRVRTKTKNGSSGTRGRTAKARASKSSPRSVGSFRTNGQNNKSSRNAFTPMWPSSPQQERQQETKSSAPQPSNPARPANTKKRWPRQAVIDWEIWGHEYPSWFFTVWPELKP